MDWSFNVNPQRLYTLGGGSSACGPKVFGLQLSADVAVNFSIYGGVTPEISTCPPTQCANSPAAVAVNIAPGSCQGIQLQGLSRTVFVSSYSYSKDKIGYGTETWGGNAYVTPTSLESWNCDQKCAAPEPTYVVLGAAEGTIESEYDIDIQTVVGARFRADQCIVETTKGSVQASQTSVGEYTYVKHGTFQSIGNSIFCAPGVMGKASVSLALTPVYIGKAP